MGLGDWVRELGKRRLGGVGPVALPAHRRTSGWTCQGLHWGRIGTPRANRRDFLGLLGLDLLEGECLSSSWKNLRDLSHQEAHHVGTWLWHYGHRELISWTQGRIILALSNYSIGSLVEGAWDLVYRVCVLVSALSEGKDHICHSPLHTYHLIYA